MLMTWLLSCVFTVSVCVAADVTIGFERDHYSVREEDKTLEVCAAVTKGELSGATEVQLTVDTLSSDATVSSDATALQDFTPITGQAINFDSENQRVCMDIAILEDEYVEANETFTIVLLGFTVSLIPHLATVTIVDNDVIVIGITTNTPVVSEDVGVVNVTVTLLQGVPFRPLALQVFTVDGTSTVPVDYSAMNNNVTLSSNVTQVHLSISVLDDPYLEYEEHFFVKLLLVSDTLQVVTLSSDTLSIRIMDNDVITVGFDPDMYNVSENEERVVVCVRLLGVTERDFSVNAAVISGNATPALDYSLPQSTVLLFRFNATADTSCLEIEVTDDYIPELQEQVTLQLDANATFVMLSPDTATINIADNDMVAVGFDSDIYNVVENEERVVVCLRLFEGVIERDFSVSATVINGNATTDLDYSLPQLQFIFNVTTTNSCLVIEVTDDSAFELSEQFTLQLDTSFTFVLLSPDTATVHITDNDYPAVSFQEEAYTVTQGYVSVTLCVDVVGLRHAVVRVTVHTEDGSATSASGDYTATTEELEFPELSNISRKCFVVNISSNVALESSKFFQVVLTSMAFNDTASVYIIQSNSAEFQVKNLASLIQSGNITVEEAAQILDEVLNTQINSGTLASQNFSQNFISVADTLLTVESMHSDPTMDDGFMVVISVLNTLDTFALRAYDPTGGTLETDDEHIKLDVTMLDVSRYEDQSVVGISEAGNEIIIPSELLNQVGYLNVTLASFFFKNISEILPATEKSKVISPVISSTLGCGNSSCKLSPTSQEFVRFTLLHSNTGGMNTTCVFLNFTSDRVELSDEGCAVVESNATVTVCECNHLTHFAILLSPNNPVSGRHIVNLQVIGYVGVSISLLCLLITVVVFICIRALWSMRVFIHINLCINLMIAQVIFISAVDKTANKRGCQAVAVLLQYFFLVTFMWMLMEGVVLYVVLVRVFIKHHKRYVAGFTVASYGIPAIYMGVLSLPLGFALNNEPDYGSESACWLNYDTHFIWAFIVPIIVIILLNVGFFIMAIVIMFKHERKGAKKARFQRIIHWLKSSISLVIIMGVTWIIGVLAFHKALLAFAYIFTICVAFQGCFIFILFVVLSPQVREQCKKWWRHRVASSEFLSQHFGSSGDERFLHRQLTRLTSFRTSFSSRESHITQRSRGFSTTENGKNGSVIAAELVTKEPPPSDILNEYVSSPVIMGDDEKVSEAEYIRPPVHVTPHTEAETTDVDTVSMGLPPSTKRPPSTELSQSTELPSTCDNTECTDL